MIWLINKKFCCYLALQVHVMCLQCPKINWSIPPSKNGKNKQVLEYNTLGSVQVLYKQVFRTDGPTDERTDGQTKGRMNEQTKERTNERANEQTKERTDERMKGLVGFMSCCRS